MTWWWGKRRRLGCRFCSSRTGYAPTTAAGRGIHPVPNVHSVAGRWHEPAGPEKTFRTGRMPRPAAWRNVRADGIDRVCLRARRAVVIVPSRTGYAPTTAAGRGMRPVPNVYPVADRWHGTADPEKTFRTGRMPRPAWGRNGSSGIVDVAGSSAESAYSPVTRPSTKPESVTCPHAACRWT